MELETDGERTVGGPPGERFLLTTTTVIIESGVETEELVRGFERYG